MNAGGDHRGPHRRRLRRRDAAARARRRRARSRSSAPASRARRTSRRCARCATSTASSRGAGRPGAPPPSSTASRRSRPPRRRCATPTSSSRRPRRAEPIVQREWLKEGAHVNAVGSSIPTTRELDTADDGATRRCSSTGASRRVNEAGDFLFPQREGAIGPEHIRAEIGELLIGAGRGTPLRRRADGLQVARPRGRGPRRRRARAAARRGRGRRARWSRCDRRSTRSAARARCSTGIAIRTPLVRLDVDADAEIWLKLEMLQPVSSFKIRGAGNAILQATDEELAGGVLTASAGNMAQGVAYAARLRGVPGDDRRPGARAADEDRRDRALRRPRRSRCRTTSGGSVLVDRPLRGRRRPLRPPGRRRRA